MQACFPPFDFLLLCLFVSPFACFPVVARLCFFVCRFLFACWRICLSVSLRPRACVCLSVSAFASLFGSLFLSACLEYVGFLLFAPLYLLAPLFFGCAFLCLSLPDRVFPSLVVSIFMPVFCVSSPGVVSLFSPA